MPFELKEFLNPKTVVTPAIGSGLVVIISNAVKSDLLPDPHIRYVYVALGMSFLVCLLVWGTSDTSWRLKLLLYIINSLFVFSSAVGINEMSDKARRDLRPASSATGTATSPPPNPVLPVDLKRAEPRPPILSSWLGRSPIAIQAMKNKSYAPGPIPAGDGGHLLRVDLSAPGPITKVVFTCGGSACGWVHECPDGGKCGSIGQTAIHGSTATWYGWSNTGNETTLNFDIYFDPPPS